mmetsp:Transcript_114616/g.208525  ORF Transcript_114616/g.208525 Transcript_114616/m.208525 type:complete len:186 (-) Transcript_114616:58-615(-)
MHKTVLFLTCVAFAVNGRRVSTSQMASKQERVQIRETLKPLAMLFLSFNNPAPEGWRHTGLSRRLGASPGYAVKAPPQGHLRHANVFLALKKEISVTPMSKEEAEKQHGISTWGTWGSGVDKFDWQWGGDEWAYILEGEAIITPTGEWADCKTTKIQAGDLCIFPGGMTCVWDVIKPLNKHFNYP